MRFKTHANVCYLLKTSIFYAHWLSSLNVPVYFSNIFDVFVCVIEIFMRNKKGIQMENEDGWKKN